MKSKTLKKTPSFFYPLLIVVVWLVAYIVCQIVFQRKLGWDEVAYLSVAKGIARDFDFSARGYTIMGILKHGYPTHFINFPIFSIYLAIFLKLFGESLQVAYFTNWLSALGVCILIYYIFLLLSDKDEKFAFFVAISYLLFPGIIRYCDTAMMEQFGCFLLSLFVYLVLKDYVSGKFSFLTALKFSFAFLVLWLYKSLYIGIFFGAFIFISLAYSSKITGKQLSSKMPLHLFLVSSYGIFAILYYLFKNFIFLPVAPMMNFTSTHEMQQVYADFLGGFFNNFFLNLTTNISNFFMHVVLPYFIYPTVYTNPTTQFYIFVPHVIYVAVFFFLLFLAVVLTFSSWVKLSPQGKLFSCLTLGTIISFNLIFNVLFSTTIENIWRYNVYSLPLYICYLALILRSNLNYLKPFYSEHPVAFKGIVFLFFLFVYLPLSLSMINIQQALWDGYHIKAKRNGEIVKAFIKDSTPKFVYFNDGIHTVFNDYPIKQVFKDATNEQLIQVNMILPEPIEYLFLKPTDWLFKNNQDNILKGQPILEGKYKPFGFDQNEKIIVYRLED